MRKTFTRILFAILFFGATSAGAQSKKHEISVGVGDWTSNQIGAIISDGFLMAFTVGIYSANAKYLLPAANISYRYAVRPRIAVGGTLVYNCVTAEAYMEEERYGDVWTNYYTVAAEATFQYNQGDRFKFYGFVGLGATICEGRIKKVSSAGTDRATTCYINFQITPVGFKFGNSWGGFVEFGFGYKGMLSGGMFVRL